MHATLATTLVSRGLRRILRGAAARNGAYQAKNIRADIGVALAS